jgi:cytochrome P450
VLLADTVRRDPSVQLTTRVAASALTVGGVTIPPGGRILVLLAAANHDPGADGAVFTFGAGRRPCPGEDHAMALAAGVLDALTGTVTTTAVTYEPRPNLRIPNEIAMMG